MALHPGIGTPVLDRLGPRDVPEVLLFLEDDPVLNVYLIALVLRDALARPHDTWWGARRDGRLTAILYVGAHSGAVLPAGDDLEAHRALGQVAREEKPATPARLQVIGPRDAVAALRERYPGPGASARLERLQVYLVLERSPGCSCARASSACSSMTSTPLRSRSTRSSVSARSPPGRARSSSGKTDSD
jgi:hypothetical protein